MKKWWGKFKDFVYIIGLLGIGCGWFISASVTKIKNELKDEAQDAKIAAQAEEINQLKMENRKNEGYAKENANNIDWIIRVLVIESDSPGSP